MRGLTKTETGMVGQLSFAVLAMLGSRGILKVGFPAVDEEGRDAEIHLAGEFTPALAIQVKTTMTLHGNRLAITFSVVPNNVIDHPRYWYFFGYLDQTLMQFSKYVFLVPSEVVHSRLHLLPGKKRPQVNFKASVAADSHDRWTPYRLDPNVAAQRLVDLTRQGYDDLGLASTLLGQARLPGTCWLGLKPATPARRSGRGRMPGASAPVSGSAPSATRG
jgi:hypothetical protein